MHLLIAELGADVVEDKSHSRPLSDLGYLWHLPIDDTIEIATELVQTAIVYSEETAVSVGPLFSLVSRDRKAEKGSIRFRLSPLLIQIMEDSNHWAFLQKQVVLAFRSRYALRLYELIALRKGLKHKSNERLPLAEIRVKFGIPDGHMERWVHIRQKVLDKAITEVNQLSGFKVSYEPYKKGRSVAGIVLSWEVNDAPARAKAKTELDRHSAGRNARSKGTEETPVAGFPATGSIDFAPDKRWRDTARKCGNGKDIDLIASDFRKWCEVKKINLDARTIEKAFTTFCQSSKL